MAGDWWTVYGESCGQLDGHGDWSGSHDWVPCSHARFLQVEEEEWINNTTFCVGSDSVCQVSIYLSQIYLVYFPPTESGYISSYFPQQNFCISLSGM